MKCVRVIVLAAIGLAAGTAARTADPGDPDGLWVSRQRYGPDVRGTLVILPVDKTLRADIAGFSVPVRVEGRKLSFTLPDGKGSFRGIRAGNDLAGQWLQTEGGWAYSTPVTLQADGTQRWRGHVAPKENRMTFFLPIKRTSDGRRSTYLRNPERNLGRFIPVSRIEVEGETVQLLGSKPGAKDETVIAAGRRDVDAGIISLPLNGATFDFERETANTSAFFTRGRVGERYVYAPPVQFADGWPTSTLEKEGIAREPIERFVQKLIDMPMDGIGSSQIHSLLIARNGRLVLEEYFHGYDRETPHDTRSAAKSWTAVLIGAAMQSGVPIRLDTPVYQTMLGHVPADLDPRKRAMNLEHLLSMTAGFDCDDAKMRPGAEDVMQDQTDEPDWYRYTLNVPMAYAPGEQIVYCSAEANLAGGLLERVAGEPLPEMFDRLVGRPLHMGRYHLFLTPTGAAYGGGGHHFQPRDFLKLAQLMLNKGRWEGRQIISEQWVQKSGAALRNLTPSQTYGYLWNSVEYPYKGRMLHAYFAGGNGGQVFMGIPELQLAIGFTGGNYADPVLFRSQREFIPQDILPAVN